MSFLGRRRPVAQPHQEGHVLRDMDTYVDSLTVDVNAVSVASFQALMVSFCYNKITP